jgi:hypothetical protein
VGWGEMCWRRRWAGRRCVPMESRWWRIQIDVMVKWQIIQRGFDERIKPLRSKPLSNCILLLAKFILTKFWWTLWNLIHS